MIVNHNHNLFDFDSFFFDFALQRTDQPRSYEERAGWSQGSLRDSCNSEREN